jgi:hypothetical protein
MSLPHWNYFLAVERDVDNLTRYVEFSMANFSVYSVEIARILMASTQETDVLLRQLCQTHGSSATDEAGYRLFIPRQFSKLPTIEVEVARYALKFTPFRDWLFNSTPKWWTANNKVKHQRHTHFAEASLENMLSSVCALLIANIYYYGSTSQLGEIWPGSQMLYPDGMVEGVSPTAFGLMTLYKLP